MVVGANSRLDELQAGLLRVKLTYMEDITNERYELGRRYAEGITNPLVIKPTVADGSTCVWHQYVLRVPSKEGQNKGEVRDAFRQFLEDNEIMTLIHYPIPPHRSQAYEYLGLSEGSLPITELYANEVVSLPIYTGMTEEEQQRVIDCVNAWKG